MNLVELSDGTFRKELRPIQGQPFYSNWLEALMIRRAAFETHGNKGDIDSETGLPRRVIIPYDRYQEQAAVVNPDGTASVICISCAQPTAYMDIVGTARLGKKDGIKRVGVDKIRVGAIVQFKLDEPANERHNGKIISIVSRWRMKSVSKMGYGCPSCAELYAAEVARVDDDNAGKQALHQAMTEIYTKKGNIAALQALKPPKLFSAWLDILGGSVMLQQFTEVQARKL